MPLIYIIRPGNPPKLFTAALAGKLFIPHRQLQLHELPVWSWPAPAMTVATAPAAPVPAAPVPVAAAPPASTVTVVGAAAALGSTFWRPPGVREVPFVPTARALKSAIVLSPVVAALTLKTMPLPQWIPFCCLQ
jgi:hypothetical protein